MKRVKWEKFKNPAPMEHAIIAICEAMSITEEELKSHVRKEDYLIARKIISPYARRVIGMKYKDIVKTINKKHSSVILNEVTFDKLRLVNDKRLNEALESFRLNLKKINENYDTVIPVRYWSRRKDF